MLTYSEAKQMMERARNGRRKLENNTYLIRLAPADVRGATGTAAHYAVRLHATDVVILHPDGSYTLDSGGWRTVTTKDRINHYAPGTVSSDKGSWYYYPEYGNWTRRYPFADGMTVHADGAVTGSGPDETAIRREILREIRTYCDGYAAHAVAQKGLEEPGPGDCLGCLMTTASAESKKGGKAPWGQDAVTKPGADMPMGVSHIFEHFREGYYVPSLLWRAMQRRGNPAFCWSMADRYAQQGDGRWVRDELRAYFKRLMPALVAYAVETDWTARGRI